MCSLCWPKRTSAGRRSHEECDQWIEAINSLVQGGERALLYYYLSLPESIQCCFSPLLKKFCWLVVPSDKI